MTVEAVILAGGEGKRLGLSVPKPLLDLCGKPLSQHVLETAAKVSDHLHLVHSPDTGEAFNAMLEEAGLSCTLHVQEKPRGTADALTYALPALPDDAIVLVLCADVPLLEAETLEQLLKARPESGLAFLTTRVAETHLGRVIRNAEGEVVAIREYADASEEERQLDECNAGVMAASAESFRRWCAGLDTENAQQELYLTDCIAQAVHEGVAIGTHECSHVEGLGINNSAEYVSVAQHWQQQAREKLIAQGVLLEAPETIWLSGDVVAEAGVRIGSHVVFEGAVRLRSGAQIRSHVSLRNCDIGPDACIEAFSVIEQARIGARCRVGPFARLRPETVMEEDSRVGNFVEVKKSTIGEGTKINHLSYVGDSQVGRDVNIGAGTITCNYDGARKHPTVIGDDVFIGSGTQLIAPVTIGAGATIGAGSTITKDAPPGELSLSRKKQETRKGWRRPQKD